MGEHMNNRTREYKNVSPDSGVYKDSNFGHIQAASDLPTLVSFAGFHITGH